MINLYQVLHLSPYAHRDEIVAALQRYQNQANADSRIIQAAQKWLLLDDIRLRYDARLRAEQPDFFQAAETFSAQSDYVIVDDEQPSETENVPQNEDEYYVPLLWNPKAIAIWSLLFTPALGAWLQAINWRELGDEKAAKLNMNIMYVIVGSSFALALFTILTGIDWGLLIHFLVWVAWFLTLSRKHIDFVENAIGDDYNRKTWHKTLLFTLLCLIGYVLAVMLLIYLAIKMDLAHPSLFE